MTSHDGPGSGIRSGVRRLFRLPLRRRDVARVDADDELDAYVEARIEYLTARGMSPVEARVETLKRLGGTIEEVRTLLRSSAERRETRMRIGDYMDDLIQDLRHTIRQLRRAPAFTAVALITLALGVGANTAIYSVVHHLLLAPLPYPDGNRVVAFRQAFGDGDMLFPARAPLVEAWQARSHAVEVFGAMQRRAFRVEEMQTQDTTRGAFITPSLLEVLGVRPAVGRGFVAADAEPGAGAAAMISTRAWRQQFGGRADVVGSTIHVDGAPYVVIGVVPMSDAFPRERRPAPARARAAAGLDASPDLWLPASFQAIAQNAETFGRLRTGISAADASRELDAIMKTLPDSANAYDYARSTARAMRAQDFLEAKEVRTIEVLFLAAGVLLLIACVNVANLLLSRAWTRRREIAIRATLGAGRGRLARQMLTESLALALAGGVLGLAIAWQAIRVIIAVRPPALDHLTTVHVDLSVLLWSLGISVATGLAFGAAPATLSPIRVSADTLRNETRSASGSVSARRVRAALVVAEVALSLVLLVGAGLLFRAFTVLQRTSLGFEPRGLVSISVLTPPGTVAPEERVALRRTVLERIRAVPGVAAVAVGTLPGMGFAVAANIEVEGNDAPRATGIRASTTSFVTPDYFRVARIALLQGRALDSTDAGVANGVVINRSLAERLWPDGRALGSKLRVNGGRPMPWSTVVGIVADVRLPGVRGNREELQIYSLPLPQIPTGAYLVRTPLSPDAIVPTLRNVIAATDSRLRVGTATTGDAAIHDVLAPARFSMALLGAFAVVALILATVGLYGVISYAVTQRTREIGIRVALGASPSAVTGLVLGDGFKLIAVGLVIGLAAAAATSRLLGSMLYGMSPADPLTYSAIAGLVAAVAFVASFAPARRALRIDPLEALRAD